MVQHTTQTSEDRYIPFHFFQLISHTQYFRRLYQLISSFCFDVQASPPVDSELLAFLKGDPFQWPPPPSTTSHDDPTATATTAVAASHAHDASASSSTLAAAAAAAAADAASWRESGLRGLGLEAWASELASVGAIDLNALRDEQRFSDKVLKGPQVYVAIEQS